MKPPANLSAAQAAVFKRGELVVGQSGCLACHVIGDNGNNGPGPTSHTSARWSRRRRSRRR